MAARTAPRVVVCATLVASGGLTIAAAAQRWWPCRPYDFDAPQCAKWQSDYYDYLAPSAPWTPIGSAAQVGGVGLILLALGVLALPRVLAPEAPRGVAWFVGGVMAAGVSVLGVISLLAGQAGHPVAVSFITPSAAVWFLASPAALLTLFVLIVIDSGRLRWRVTALCLLMCSTPVAALMITVMVFGYISYDATPWAEGVGGVMIVMAAAAVWLGTGTKRWTAEGSRTNDLVGAARGGLA